MKKIQKEDLFLFQEAGDIVDYRIILENCNSFVAKFDSYFAISKYLLQEDLYYDDFYGNRLTSKTTSEELLIDTLDLLNDHLLDVYKFTNQISAIEECMRCVNEYFIDLRPQDVELKRLAYSCISPHLFVNYLNGEFYHDFIKKENRSIDKVKQNFSYRDIFFNSSTSYRVLKYYHLVLDSKDMILDKVLQNEVKIVAGKRKLIEKALVLQNKLKGKLSKKYAKDIELRENYTCRFFVELYLNQHLNLLYEKTKQIHLCKFALDTIESVFPGIEDICEDDIEKGQYRKYIFPDSFLKIVKSEFISEIGGRNINNVPFTRLKLLEQKAYYEKYINSLLKMIIDGSNFGGEKAIIKNSTYRNGRVS
ncbi:hypothetical protein [Flavobacterium sp.]|uniref:hypothetical protein n=1 Tax=Flavobacterium sp. TaxID=239 RepID=UPI003B9B97FC